MNARNMPGFTAENATLTAPAHYRTAGVFDSQANPLNGAAPRVADQITTSPGRYAASDNGWSVGYATNVVNATETVKKYPKSRQFQPRHRSVRTCQSSFCRTRVPPPR
jgi:hypothetical protein